MRTFGTLATYKDHWVITGEPHMIVKLKRVFGKMDTHTPGEARLSHSVENARDMLWFIERYPLKMTESGRRKLAKDSKRYVEQMKLLDQLLSGEVQSDHFEMAIPPRDYQRLAATAFLRSKALLLGDDVGLGKTCVGICALTDKRTRPALIATLPAITRQWANEFAKFAPSLRTHIAKKGTPYELKDGDGYLPDVLIMNYHKLHGWARSLVEKGLVKLVIFDEIQELRNTGTDKYNAATLIARHADYRLGLSATPIFNYGDEMYHVMSVLKDDALGNYDEFRREWCSGVTVKDPRALGSYLRETGLFLRRTRIECGREIPPVTTIPYAIDADQEELEKIKGNAADLARIVLSHKRNESFLAAGEFDIMMRHATGLAKAPFVAEFVRLMVESGESVLLFGWHHDVYDIWMEKLKDFNPVLFTGLQTPTQKEVSKKAFLEKESKVLIMSLRAGAGVDGLQSACRTVVFGEIDWSPGCHEQNIGRIARDGQTNPVAAYFLLSDSGSDPVMADVLGLKRQQVEGIRDPNKQIIEKMQSVEDRVQKLAEHYLLSRGESLSLPEPEEIEEDF